MLQNYYKEYKQIQIKKFKKKKEFVILEFNGDQLKGIKKFIYLF